MGHITNETLLEGLNWRYATKHFDATKKIPAETWATLEQTLVLTPTSFGLQPYQFLVIENPAVRAQLLLHSWHQKQVVDASHLIVFAVRTEITVADVDKYIQRALEVGKLPAGTLDKYRHVIIHAVVDGLSSHAAHGWAARQTYIALGNLLTAAGLLGVDTSPLEGIVPAEYDKILGLEKSGYTTVVACALGYRSEHDKYANFAKVRFEADQVIRHI
jgi:nitroreductase